MRLVLAWFAVIGFMTQAMAQEAFEELEGEEREACGAAICLSTDVDIPDECASYLRSFFAVPKARREAFLNQCPVVVDQYNDHNELVTLLKELSRK